MRTIRAIHQAVFEPIADLLTYRAIPTASIGMDQLDPFIFLNHHGWQQYPPNNRGLPFGPHPHRGFETVTFILEGDLMHRDSSGNESVIKAGGIQWMTAGKGLIHAEVSSSDFKRYGGSLEILQLWINLPSHLKMTDPAYKGIQKEEIPVVKLDEGKIHLYAISGIWQKVQGAFKPLTDISLAYLHFKEGSSTGFSIGTEKNIFFYIVKGKILVNDKTAEMHQLVEFNNDDEALVIKAETDALILLGYATPFKEPVVAHGPFVMNTREEIAMAYEDYNKGLFGAELDVP